MCEICRRNPCDPRCPNSEEPAGKLICVKCKGPVYDGDKYLDSAVGIICMDCLEDMATEELIEACGEELAQA